MEAWKNDFQSVTAPHLTHIQFNKGDDEYEEEFGFTMMQLSEENKKAFTWSNLERVFVQFVEEEDHPMIYFASQIAKLNNVKIYIKGEEEDPTAYLEKHFPTH